MSTNPAEDETTTARAATARVATGRALALVHTIRDDGPEGVARLTEDLDHAALVALAVALAALCPADVDPHRALEWCDLPPQQWSDATVVHEAGRAEDGARDAVALTGQAELGRRLRDTLAAASVRPLMRGRVARILTSSPRPRTPGATRRSA